MKKAKADALWAISVPSAFAVLIVAIASASIAGIADKYFAHQENMLKLQIEATKELP